MSVIIDLAVFPVDQGESVSGEVARAVRIIKESGVPHRVHAMGTQMEGEWDTLMEIVTRCFEAVKSGSNRVYLTLKADYRKGPAGRLESKIRSLEKKLE